MFQSIFTRFCGTTRVAACVSDPAHSPASPTLRPALVERLHRENRGHMGSTARTQTLKEIHMIMKSLRFGSNLLAVALLVLVCSSLASAQATRTWVSGVGDDAN